MENYNWQRPAITNGTYTGLGLRPEKTVQMVTVDDIGAFAALAFAHPEEYLGKTIELAGDEMTETQIAATFARVIGRPVHLVHPSSPEGAGAEPEMAALFRFFNGTGCDADIAALRKVYPGLHTLEQ
jgi:uncharacterized protein YbjT (DUF2867 family)